MRPFQSKVSETLKTKTISLFAPRVEAVKPSKIAQALAASMAPPQND